MYVIFYTVVARTIGDLEAVPSSDIGKRLRSFNH